MVLPRRRDNLHAEMSSFVGRRREVAEAKRLLSSARLLTLTGTGGVGKTRLALRVARDVRRAFPDGIWLVDLGELEDPGLLVRTVAVALGLGDRSTRSLIREYFEDKGLLLVLDNCEHLLDGCAELAGELLASAPALRILATSRQALRVEGEYVIPVSPLPVPDPDNLPSTGALGEFGAVRLFADRAEAVVPGFTVDAANRAAVARICQRLDGIPLAIELAAARLQVLSAEQIVDRLDDRFRLLTTGARTSLPRQHTLRAAIDWSYDLCPSPEQALWARLSVFSGGFGLTAAEEVCSGGGIGRADVFDLVAALVDKSILGREEHGGGVRYRMLETIRQYGRDRLAGSGQQRTLLTRHRDFYRLLAAQAEADWFGPRQVEWLAHLHQEHPNLRLALEFCLTEPGHARTGLEMAADLQGFWFATGRYGEGRRWLDRALEVDSEPTAGRAKALAICGQLALLLGDPDRAADLLAECQSAAQWLGRPRDLARAAQYSSLAALYRSDPSGSLRLAEEALAGYRAAGDLANVSSTLTQLTLAASFAGDPRAAGIGAECLTLCRANGAQWSESWVLTAVGLGMWLRGERPAASRPIRKALRLKRPVHDPWGTAVCLEVLAWIAAAEERYQRSAQLLGASQTLSRSTGAPLTAAGPLDRHHDACERRTREALGRQRFRTMFSRGAHLTLEEACAYALTQTARRGSPERPRRPAAAATPLSRREQQVAELIAEGLSNQEIAAKLVISRRTAEGHVEHILVKLGFTTRTQIATWVSRSREQ